MRTRLERERPDPIWNSTSLIITHTTSLHLNANPHPIKTQIHKIANFHKLATLFSLSLISLRFFITGTVLRFLSLIRFLWFGFICFGVFKVSLSFVLEKKRKKKWVQIYIRSVRCMAVQYLVHSLIDSRSVLFSILLSLLLYVTLEAVLNLWIDFAAVPKNYRTWATFGKSLIIRFVLFFFFFTYKKKT